MNNKYIAKLFFEIAQLLDIKGTPFKPAAYRKAAQFLEELKEDVPLIYEKGGLKGLEKLPKIGKSMAKKIEEFLKKGRIKYLDELKKETAIRHIITHYFKTKDVSLEELKRNAKKRKIIYSRFTKPAKQLLELAGSVELAEKALTKVAQWAKTRNLDYAIETVFKKWLELDRLKPKEIVKKPYYRGDPMIWSETKRKWYVISPEGDWLEFAGKESDVEWRVVK
ncbi:MAG: DNA polymerase (family X) [Parcubacteria group bacterium Gr01-1014_30]|nr:MAG: DNA polymerase (family X) [Parcubacteria group bacterium Gr01-1014_30]